MQGFGSMIPPMSTKKACLWGEEGIVLYLAKAAELLDVLVGRFPLLSSQADGETSGKEMVNSCQLTRCISPSVGVESGGGRLRHTQG